MTIANRQTAGDSLKWWQPELPAVCTCISLGPQELEGSFMYISKATKETGLASRTIRYYEKLGLIGPKRLPNGYRYYSANDIARLRFVKRARSLGFPLNDCRALVRLVEDNERRSRDVKLLAEGHLATVTTKYAQLDTIRDRLQELIAACPGDDAAACPIIDELTT